MYQGQEADAVPNHLSSEHISAVLSPLNSERLREISDSFLFARFSIGVTSINGEGKTLSAQQKRDVLEALGVISSEEGEASHGFFARLFRKYTLKTSEKDLSDRPTPRPALTAEELDEMYIKRQYEISLCLAEMIESVIIHHGPKITPDEFVKVASPLTYIAAREAGYWHADRAAGWSIPILGRFISDSLDEPTFGRDVYGEFLRPFQLRYQALKDKF